MLVQGGKSIFGASVGILMLDARFPRIHGDMGHAETWDFPVHYRVVRGASPEWVVRRNAEGLLPEFLDAARELAADGVDGITTNCGFLSIFQDELASASGLPVAASSLMQVAPVARLMRPGVRPGILTISSSTLTEAHLRAAGVPEGTPIGSTEGGREFTDAIVGNAQEFDMEAARDDNVEAALALKADNPDLGAIVLECTNMSPYASDIRVATGLPVFSAVSFVRWFQSALTPQQFGITKAPELSLPRYKSVH